MYVVFLEYTTRLEKIMTPKNSERSGVHPYLRRQSRCVSGRHSHNQPYLHPQLSILDFTCSCYCKSGSYYPKHLYMPAYTLRNTTLGSSLLSNAGYVHPNVKTNSSLAHSIRVGTISYDICVAMLIFILFN